MGMGLGRDGMGWDVTWWWARKKNKSASMPVSHVAAAKKAEHCRMITHNLCGFGVTGIPRISIMCMGLFWVVAKVTPNDFLNFCCSYLLVHAHLWIHRWHGGGGVNERITFFFSSFGGKGWAFPQSQSSSNAWDKAQCFVYKQTKPQTRRSLTTYSNWIAWK